MLVRPPAARRSLPLRRISPTNRPQLVARLPFIHSFRPSSRIFLTARPELPLRRGNTPHDGYGPTFQRSLATAISDPLRQDEIPFSNSYVHPSPRPRLSDMRPFDPSAPLLLKLDKTPIPRTRSIQGVPGGLDEMLSVFDACLQVGKLDRAALVLTRLSDKPIPSHHLIALHNQYLRAAIDKAFEQPDSEWASSLHQWYELHIRSKELPQTSETVACMLKVSLLSAQGSRLERLVTRYMGMLPDDDAIYQVLSEVDILNQQDFGVISSIYQPASRLLDDWEIPLPEEEPHLPTEEASPTQIASLFETKPEQDDVPEVMAVPQKGLGLKSLRGILSFFSKIEGVDISKLSLAERREVQARLEKDCVDSAVARWKEENRALMKMGLNSSLSTNALNSQLYEWHYALERKLKEEFSLFKESEQRERKNAEDQDRCLYAPFLSQSNPTRLAAVTILGVLNAISASGADKGIQLSLLLTQLSKAVEDDIKHLLRHEQLESKYKARKAIARRKEGTSMDSSTVQSTAQAEAKPNIVEPSIYEIKSWPVLIKTKVGVALLSALIDTAKVNVVREHPETKALVSQRQPAMAHTTINRKGRKVGLIMPNKFLVELLKREPRGDFLARHLPMLVDPEPWTKFDKGGFIEYPAQLVRVKHGEKDQRIYAEAAMERGDMEQVSKGLDVLGRTGWRINRNVFNVMLEAWNSGKEIANIPPLDPQIPVPPEPEPSDNPLQRREWVRAVKAVENEKSGLHSERCFMNFQLEIARAFKDQTFYFPHNMDFRGRAYPIPTYLNHMGADHVRGLLYFARGKELGENGLRWLKVHLANVFGYDKASLKEREQFATDHLKEIYDSATNPLTGDRWWLQAEDAWQCLATCFELKAALESPDPVKYVSHLPVHQDGTCNGLQHYAALGGDVWGAQQVNLLPGDRPADVYSAVAELVKQTIADELKEDNIFAKAADGKITRKVVKQTVMTNVYGVTFVGAKAQVLKQLEAAYPNLKEETGIPPPMLASYVATKIFKALSTMFRGAHDIQYWLGECAGRICRALTPEQIERIANGDAGPTKKHSSSLRGTKQKRHIEDIISQFNSTLIWTTPLRMPVVQPYRKSEVRVIATSLQDLNLHTPERSDPVNRRKQLQAFPPNFIHSLDASHMLLSALECDELNLTFAAVHDSFWTHAADIDVMNRVLRDCFIKIHSDDVIGRLLSEFEARYKGSVYLCNLERNAPAEARIKKLRKERNISLKAELLEEGERLRLLMSSDPEEVQKGREMVTPASIFDEMSATQPLSTIDEMESLGLGNIPGENAVDTMEAVLDEAEGELSADSGVPDDNTRPYPEDTSDLQSMLDVNQFEAHITGDARRVAREAEKKARAKSKSVGISLWMPLTFPEVPKKGDFDVSQLKDSQYFFS
ncbi:DNA/RNA polymerase [Hypoxylon sp. FL1150]|nr:DNA/RNA polymerase [Hypoxylon sp. FL1150]